MPTATDLVTDLPADFEVFGQAVDSSMADLLGGTTGQILAKNSNTNMDFVWITNDVGDITEVAAGTGISGGGTSGAVTITNSMATEITAKGDLIVGTGNAAFDNLPAGTNGHVLTADSTVSPTGLKWAAPAGFGTITAYTPTLSGITIGNGTFANVGYSESGDLVWFSGQVLFGSTTSYTGVFKISLPVTAKSQGAGVTQRNPTMWVTVSDTSTGYIYPSFAGVDNAGTNLTLWTSLANQAYLQNQAQEVQQTVPITFADGDGLFWSVFYRKA